MAWKKGTASVWEREKQTGQRASILVRVLDYFRYARPVRTTYVYPVWREKSFGRGDDDLQNGLTAAKKLIRISGLLAQAAACFDPSAQEPAQAAVRGQYSFEQAKAALNGLLDYINRRPSIGTFFDDRTAGNFRSVVRDFQCAEIAFQKAGRTREAEGRAGYIQKAAACMERAARTLDAIRARAAGKLQG
ncbi:MAG: hypothetical protein HFE86_07410 [Clostridiales bacterium]|nr:hypothetical protein [Clostridiales bacterium]